MQQPKQGIWVLGGCQSDFARNLAREGVGFDGLTAEVVRGALEIVKMQECGGALSGRGGVCGLRAHALSPPR